MEDHLLCEKLKVQFGDMNYDVGLPRKRLLQMRLLWGLAGMGSGGELLDDSLSKGCVSCPQRLYHH